LANKRRRLFWFYYGSAISLLLIVMTGLNWRVLVLLVPLAGYYWLFLIKLKSSLQFFTNRYAEILYPATVKRYLEHFSINQFLTQNNLAFRFTLILLALTVGAVLGTQPTEFLSPVP